MKVGIAGKGGAGKTTIAGTLARVFAADGHQVLAIDADLNPNLGPTLGIPREHLDAGRSLPDDLLEHRTIDGRERVVLSRPLEDILSDYALDAPDKIRLLTMGRPDGAGGG